MPRDAAAPGERVFALIAAEMGAAVAPGARMTPLAGGAVLRHFRLDFEVMSGAHAEPRSWVLRADGASKLGLGLPRAQEFAVLRVLHGAGLKVPRPIFMCCDKSVLGAPFFVTEFVAGAASGAAIVAEGANESLAAALGRELARLHVLDLAGTLRFLGHPPRDAACARLEELERYLAEDPDPHPVASLALSWLERHKPAPARPVLGHGDFRTGNYLVAGRELRAVLDWDFAQWSDPAEDIAWFCSKLWRCGALAREAGGIAPRPAFYGGYEAVAGAPIDPARIHYWEVMAALRWLVIALKQRDRFLKQGERSLDLALTGRRPAECELEILMLTLGSRAPPLPHPRAGVPRDCSHERGRPSTREQSPFRDRPSGEELAALARERDDPLAMRCRAIAARERSFGEAGFASCRAALAARYGAGPDGAGLAALAAALRAGSRDAELLAILWTMTLQKLRESNPEFLAANDLA